MSHSDSEMLSTLPQELLDYIVSFVPSHVPSRREQRALAVLCRTSKRFLPTAQQLLYHSPLGDSVTLSWQRPLKLLKSLSFDNRRLGRLVRSLAGLVDVEGALREMDPPPQDEPRFRRFDLDSASNWKIEVTEACPGLDEIDISLEDENELREIQAALAQSTSTIFRIRIGGRKRQNPSAYIVPALVQSLFAGLDFPNLRRIDLGSFADMALQVPGPIMPQQISSLENTVMLSMVNLRWIFPSDSSNLRSVSLRLSDFDSTDYTTFFNLISASIQVIALDCPPHVYASIDSESYGRNEGFPSLLPHHFTALPQLTSLTLRGFQGPSVSFLHVLATSSPLLRSLDFSDCFWIPSHVSTTPNDRLNPFRDQDVVAALNRFKNLRRIEFGYLPSCEKSSYDGLKTSLKEIGIEMEWQVIGDLDSASAPW